MSELEQQIAYWYAKEECTVYQVSDLKTEFLDLMCLHKPLVLDLSKVKQFDVSFIQLLLVLQVQAKNNNIKLSVTGSSDEINNLVESIYCMPALNGFNETASTPPHQESDYVS